MSDDFTLKIKRFTPSDRRLGRNVVHDSRSRRFAAPARDPRTLSSVRHTVNIPIMDQGNVGSCTGHAGTNTLAADAFWPVSQGLLSQIDPHGYAEGLYADATLLDPWPGQWRPDDTGSDGLSVAKVLLQRGLISGYTHAFSLEAALTALADRPMMLGLSWHSSMFEPDSEGRLTISGPVEGGHEIAADQLDVQNERVWIRNQWGSSWGQGGRAFFTWDDLGRLLADDGDCTVLVPLSAPAPQPQPVPPPEPPRPFPTQEDKNLAAALLKYLNNKSAFGYLRRAAEPWLKGR